MAAFITFEGVDGAGKSTQLQLLARRLQAAGYTVVTSREPGGTPLGEAIRRMLLAREYELGVAAEVLLLAAARATHVEEVIRPALARGAVVLLDRYTDSSLAYQGGASFAGVEAVLKINEFATGGLWPDLTILLDLPVATALRRLGRPPDRMESRGLDYQERVRAAYLQLAARWPERMAVVPAEGNPEAVAEAVAATVRQRLGLNI
ncbi:MAG: dTMP kinase [Limnochordales bacterium]|nr:dTMP kinase [Limnochordales bacterium]